MTVLMNSKGRGICSTCGKVYFDELYIIRNILWKKYAQK